MHVGGDYHCVVGSNITSKENLEFSLRYGVKHLTAQLRKTANHAGWDLDELKRMRDNCDKSGVTFEAIRMDADYINLGKGPERDRELDVILGNIQKASQVGVKIITYHWTLIPIRRNRQSAATASPPRQIARLCTQRRSQPRAASGSTAFRTTTSAVP